MKQETQEQILIMKIIREMLLNLTNSLSIY